MADGLQLLRETLGAIPCSGQCAYGAHEGHDELDLGPYKGCSRTLATRALLLLEVIENVGIDESMSMTWEEIESAWMDCPLFTVTGVDHRRGAITVDYGL